MGDNSEVIIAGLKKSNHLMCDLHNKMRYSNIIDEKIGIIGPIIHHLYTGVDISIEEFKLFKLHLNYDIFKLIAFQYKTSDMFKESNSYFTQSKKVFDKMIEAMGCEVKNLGLYINYPFQEVIKWRLKHSV